MNPRQRPYSPAEKFGFLALALAALLWLFAPVLAILPLAAFLIACLLSPFFPASCFFLPVTSKGNSGQPWVCLSFDDGPNEFSTPLLLKFLRERGLAATFFVNGDKARRFPELIGQMAADGHTIGNHSKSHDNFLMFRGLRRIVAEIDETNHILAQLGLETAIFRPPVGIVTPRYAAAIAALGMTMVTFRRRPRDLGNRRLHGLAAGILSDIRGDDIILLHDALPRRGALADWLAELDALVSGIGERGLQIVSLDNLLGKKIMKRQNPGADILSFDLLGKATKDAMS